MGDLNARTSSENSTSYESEGDETSGVQFERLSTDKTTNTFGTLLLDICTACKCSILNGLVDFDFDGSFTFVTQNGSSVIDYFVLSNDLCCRQLLCSLDVESRIESSHMPVTLTFGKLCNRHIAYMVFTHQRHPFYQ